MTGGLTRQIDSALSLEGAVMALIFGGSRLPRLFVNFALLCLAQIVVFETMRTQTGRSIYGFAAIGLLLSQAFLFQPAGGLFDFRLDFAAACLYGIWLCSLLSADQRNLTAGVGLTMLAGLALLLHRLVAGIQMLPVLILLTVYSLISFMWQRTADRGRRLWHAISSLLLTLLMVTAYSASKWKAIAAYYVDGHLVGDEKIARAHEIGLFNLVDHALFYPRNLAQGQLGTAFVVLAGIGLLIAAALASGDRRQPRVIGLCMVAAVLPLATLAIDVSKSPVVASVASIPVALAVCLVCFTRGEKRHLGGLVTALTFMIGGGAAATSRMNEPTFTLDRPQLEANGALAAEVARQVTGNGWQGPIYLSVDAMTSWVNVPAMEALIRERTGRLHNLQMGLGARVDSFDLAGMETELARSQLLVTTPYAGLGQMPFDASMKTLQADFEARVSRDFQRIGSFGDSPDSLILYTRRRPLPAADQGLGGG